MFTLEQLSSNKLYRIRIKTRRRAWCLSWLFVNITNPFTQLVRSWHVLWCCLSKKYVVVWNPSSSMNLNFISNKCLNEDQCTSVFACASHNFCVPSSLFELVSSLTKKIKEQLKKVWTLSVYPVFLKQLKESLTLYKW